MINRCIMAVLVSTALLSHSYGGGVNEDKKRAEEIKQQMWNSGDKDFAVTTIPDKWKNQSAVIIAKSNLLSYRKAVLLSALNHNQYYHNRIMLLDKSAVEEYAQFSLPGSRVGGVGTKYLTYAGFKIIKPDGREMEVSLNDLVKEEQKFNSSTFERYKLAIPNLEIGDILDYYMAEEETFVISSKYYAFDPVIFQLHDNYPVMKQKISFEVLRKCYINLKSLNDAPTFKEVTDEAEDRKWFTLEDSDRESIKDIRWIHSYRELPTIKFKVVYASGSMASVIPGFIGDQGEIKSSVSTQEIRTLLKSLFSYPSVEAASLRGYMKRSFGKVKDKDKLAHEAYYLLRHINRIRSTEARLLSGGDENPDQGTLKSVIALSSYYRYKKINHDIIVGIPRHISTLDNLIMENELSFMIKVNTSKPFYISRFDNNSIVDEIDQDFQGTTAYASDGSLAPLGWMFKEVTIPVPSHEANSNVTTCNLSITDLSNGIVNADLQKSVSGLSRVYLQNYLMDYYTYAGEERDYKLKDNTQKSLQTKRENYQSSREENFLKTLKSMVEDEYDFTIENATDLNVTQTGRFDDKPEFKYNYKITAKDVLKKAGPNYLLDIGKFIESQVQIKEEERERLYNIYMPFARAFGYHIELTIPEGYIVQGEEKLTMKVENNTGGFRSTAKVENGKLIIDTYKYYTSNYYDKEEWSKIVEFLDAAYDFTQVQVLLKKR